MEYKNIIHNLKHMQFCLHVIVINMFASLSIFKQVQFIMIWNDTVPTVMTEEEI
jgi:hypothetical protein